MFSVRPYRHLNMYYMRSVFRRRAGGKPRDLLLFCLCCCDRGILLQTDFENVSIRDQEQKCRKSDVLARSRSGPCTQFSRHRRRTFPYSRRARRVLSSIIQILNGFIVQSFTTFWNNLKDNDSCTLWNSIDIKSICNLFDQNGYQDKQRPLPNSLLPGQAWYRACCHWTPG